MEKCNWILHFTLTEKTSGRRELLLEAVGKRMPTKITFSGTVRSSFLIGRKSTEASTTCLESTTHLNATSYGGDIPSDGWRDSDQNKILQILLTAGKKSYGLVILHPILMTPLTSYMKYMLWKDSKTKHCTKFG